MRVEDGNDEQYNRWIAAHGAWKDRVRELPPEDRSIAEDYGSLNEPDPTNERDLRPARMRVDRVLANLRRLRDEYHRGSSVSGITPWHAPPLSVVHARLVGEAAAAGLPTIRCIGSASLRSRVEWRNANSDRLRSKCAGG